MISKEKKLEPILLTMFQFSLILIAVRSKMFLQPYKKSLLPHTNTKTAITYISQTYKSKKMGQTPFASLTEIWQLAVADSSKAQIIQPPINVAGSTPGPGKVILPQSMISIPRHSVHKPVVRSGVSKNTLSVTRTTAQSEGSVRKNLNLGRGLQTSLIANHIHWDAIYKLQQETTLTDAEIEDSFVKAETEEVANVYADCINEISLGGDSQFVPEFFDLTKTEKMEKIVSWIGEKDFVYVEKKTNRQGQVEKFCTVSTLKDFSKIAIQYNPTTEKVVFTSTVTTSDLFESVKKTI